MKLLTVREAVALGLACSVSAWFLLDYCIASNQRLPSEQIGIILVTVLAGVVSTTILYKEQTAPGQTSSLRVIRQRLETSRLDFLNQLNDKRQRFLEQSLKQEQKQNQTLIEEPLADAVYTFYPATERAPLSAAFRDYSADHVMLTQLKQTLSQLIQANQDHLADECRTELAVWRQWLMETDSHLWKVNRFLMHVKTHPNFVIDQGISEKIKQTEFAERTAAAAQEAASAVETSATFAMLSYVAPRNKR